VGCWHTDASCFFILFLFYFLFFLLFIFLFYFIFYFFTSSIEDTQVWGAGIRMHHVCCLELQAKHAEQLAGVELPCSLVLCHISVYDQQHMFCVAAAALARALLPATSSSLWLYVPLRPRRMACMLVLACSVFLCAGVWLLRAPMMAALTRDTKIQQQLQQVLPVVVAAIICEWVTGACCDSNPSTTHGMHVSTGAQCTIASNMCLLTLAVQQQVDPASSCHSVLKNRRLR
jgi:hypothetical protein